MEGSIKKAQALLYVILIISVFLMVIVGFVSLILREHIIQRNLSDSVAAYYAAETGVEYATLRIRTNNMTPDPADDTYVGYTGQNETNKYECPNGLQSTADGNVEITCTGIVRNVRRSLNVKLPRYINSGSVVFPLYWKEIEL